ncbi:glycosyltransferase [Acinetobacter radioresistens]|uniref:glycosyltransferase n=1 Tax=Acinetobacter radioresistens TaxID=40216 RepID=UPI0020064638|nr:glycosyltransferase [Acinetobacter radioresistens]MCK4102781.1 glycosyltransferase [Acinetobacter radioresistens]
MKILYIITGLGQGGAERVVCDLADTMYKKGNEVKIVYLTGDILTKPKFSQISIEKINLNNLSSLIPAYLKLIKIVKSYQPDIVHSHMVHANLVARTARLFISIKKLICTAHSSNEGGVIRMLLYRITHSLSEVTTNVSEDARINFENLKAVPKDSMLTIVNGIDLNKFKFIKEARGNFIKNFSLDRSIKIILAVGRFNEAKNYKNLLISIDLLRKNNTLNFKLFIAGDGEQRYLIEELIRELKLKEYVILLGRREDIPELMSSCDVFVLSSDYEGLPTVLIEALACQAQIVTTKVSGALDIVNKYGTIVPIGDSYALSQGLKYVLENCDSKNIEGSLYVQEKFNLINISELWLNLYKGI